MAVTLKGSKKQFEDEMGIGFHTAFRKATDDPESGYIWQAINRMEPGSWSAVLQFVVNGLEQIYNLEWENDGPSD